MSEITCEYQPFISSVILTLLVGVRLDPGHSSWLVTPKKQTKMMVQRPSA